MLATAVIGAGPAGLLFSLIGKISMGETWDVQLFDKRETYARTHRLRMDPEPYLAIQKALNAPRFDALIAFLHEHHFSPEVNRLEAKRTGLLAELGVRRIVSEITTLKDLRADICSRGWWRGASGTRNSDRLRKGCSGGRFSPARP